MPNMAAITNVRNLLADLDVEELVRRERAGERRERADDGLDDDAAAARVENCASKNLLSAPSATPSSDGERQHQRPG